MINTVYPWLVAAKVAEEHSFLKAAKALNITQSAVSHTISKIEEEYGIILFIRNKGSVALTENGKIIIPQIQHFLNSGNTLEQLLKEMVNLRSGNVRIAAFNSATSVWLPHILKSFNSLYPGIKVEVYQNGDTKIKEMVDRGSIDLAIIPQELADVRHPFELVYKTPLVCLSDKDFIPSNGEYVVYSDLVGKTLIMQSEGYDTEIVEFINNNNLMTNVLYRFEVDDTCHKYVEEGFGICITPEMTAKCNPRDFRIWPLKPETYRNIGIVTVYPDHISPSAALFKEYMVNYMKDNNFINV